MSETVEKSIPAQKRKRFAEKKFDSYEEAKKFQSSAKEAADNLVKGLCKAKIFARYDGTFDVVLYSDVEKAKEQERKAQAVLKEGITQALQTTSEAPEKPVHGLRSKDRKKSPKKAR